MPLPLAAAPLLVGGPPAAAAVAGAATAFVPAVSTAILVRLAWQRVPDWIKEDVAFQQQQKQPSSSSWKGGGDPNEDEMERLSLVLRRLQAYSTSTRSTSTRSTSGEAVPPNLYASLLAYLQLSMQLQHHSPAYIADRNERYHSAGEPLLKSNNTTATTATTTTSSMIGHNRRTEASADTNITPTTRAKEDEEKHDSDRTERNESAVYSHSHPVETDERKTTRATECELHLRHIRQALEYAIWAYYVEDEPLLRDELERLGFALLDRTVATRPGHVGHFTAVSLQKTNNTGNTQKVLLIGIKGTSSLEDLLTDLSGQPVSYHAHQDTQEEETSRIEISITEERRQKLKTAANKSSSNSNSNSSSSSVGSSASSGYEQRIIIEPYGRSPPPSSTTKREANSSTPDNNASSSISNKNNDNDDNENYHHHHINNSHNANDAAEHHVRCHEGMLISAKRLVRSIEATVSALVVEDSSNGGGGGGGGYKLLLTGHSLGGGVACLVAVLLRARLGLSPSQLEVVAFAPPPCLDHDSAIGTIPYITSVVNNADVVPRSGLSHWAIVLELLRALSRRLDDAGLRPVGPRSTAAFLHRLAQGVGDTNTSTTTTTTTTAHKRSGRADNTPSGAATGTAMEPLWSPTEAQQAMEDAYASVEVRHPLHLYVPGRVLLLHEDWPEPPQPQPPSTSPPSTSTSPEEKEGKQKGKRDDNKNDNANNKNTNNNNNTAWNGDNEKKEQDGIAGAQNDNTRWTSGAEFDTDDDEVYVVVDSDGNRPNDDDGSSSSSSSNKGDGGSGGSSDTPPGENRNFFCTVTDGTTTALRTIGMGGGWRMLSDHTTTAYTTTLDALLLQTSAAISSSSSSSPSSSTRRASRNNNTHEDRNSE